MKPKNQNSVLIEKYLLGEATEKESLELKELLDTNEDTKQEYLRLKRVVELSETNEVIRQIDAQAEFEKFKEIRPSKEKSNIVPIAKGMKPIKFFLRVAAILVLGACIWYFSSDQQTKELYAQTNDDPITKELIDGSVVRINSNSKLNYPEKFADNIRMVELKGEAFFEVQSNDAQPFIIAVGEGRIKVTGTEFNVNANNPDSVVVTVKEGSVLFYNVKDKDNISSKTHGLTANQKGTMLASTKEITYLSNDNLNYLYWYDGILTFNDSPLKDIVKLLNNKSNLNIVLDNPESKGCRYTGSFDNKDITYILELLGLTLDISIENKEGKIIINTEGC